MAYKQRGWSAFTKKSKKLKESEKEMQRLKDVYAGLDTSNPYLDMENKFEDMPVDQRASSLEHQRFQQSQADILDSIKETGGGSSAASLAQSLSQEGKRASQESSAGIGEQERENQMLTAEESARLQKKERKGEVKSRKWEKEKQSTLLGMSQQELAAEREKKAAAKQAKWDTIASGTRSAGSMMTGS